jgi:hypothetical protein
VKRQQVGMPAGRVVGAAPVVLAEPDAPGGVLGLAAVDGAPALLFAPCESVEPCEFFTVLVAMSQH